MSDPEGLTPIYGDHAMTFETEAVLDRRRLRRRLSWWRVLALTAGALALGFLMFSSAEQAGLIGQRQIARVAIEGLITDDRDMLRLIKKLGESDKISGVILAVNSPGGTTVGGEAMFEALRELGKKKPLVAQFGTVATSAAYIVGLATDRIVARGNTITGSVGVIFQWPEIAGLLEKLGIKVNEIKSGPLKATPSPFQPLDEAGRATTEEMVAESQRWFVNLVRTRRRVDTKSISGLEEGRVYSGREALANKLIDQIGGEAEVVKYLEDQRGVPKGLNIVDWKPSRDSDWGISRLATKALARITGIAAIDQVAQLLSDDRLASLRLDGMLSIWHGTER
ncbi:MAG TPA: signal peptide peptidase SppA [Hyphomicrobiaceae bacterium]|nr:signal peptide peptidase SppA [Hyphomicrobiaceae bacterium]